MTWLASRLWARLTLVPRLSLVVALGTLLIAAGVVYQISRHITHETQNDLTVEYNRQMDTLESVVLSIFFVHEKASHDLDREELTNVLSRFKYGKDVTQISFRDTLDAASFSQSIAIQLEAPLFFSRWCGLENINLNRPVIVDGVYHGLLALSMSPNRIINQAWQHYLYMVRVMFVSLAIILLSIWLVLRKALHPLLSLAKASKALTSGDLAARVKIAGSPELQTVLLNFNQMASSFQATLAALQESEAINRTILGSLSQKIFLKDRNFLFLSVNKAYADAHGLKAEDFVGKDDFAFYPAELARKYRTDDQKVMKSGQGKDIEEADPASGKDRMTRTIKIPIRNEAGEVTALLGSFEDITERKQAEEDIRKAKEEWERTFAAIGDVVTIQDASHRILRANQRACKVLGVEDSRELVGRFCYEVFNGRTQPCDGCPAVPVAGETTTRTVEIAHNRRGKTFLVSASPVLDLDNKLSSIIYISRDVTEIKALEERLRQSQKMEAVGTLAGGIAHDFNNILTPVLAYSEMIIHGLPADSPLAEMSREVLKAGKRARDLVKQILTFSRQSEQARSPIQIHLVVKEALKLLRSSLPTTIEIKQNISTEAMVLADPTMIHQVIMNLCTNAYHAMREKGGILAVSLTEVEIAPEDYASKLPLRPGHYLRLEVSDTGCGMPRHIVERIFEPYFTTKAKEEGTGLGLSVVHGIVSKLGGHVTVYSEPGKGATFHVYFPKHLGEAGAGEAILEAASLPRGHERILVVDDEMMIARLIQVILESLGYQVITCLDSRNALEQFEAYPEDFDLVISDMTMPHLTGAELARRMLTSRPGLPIILCTGFSEIIDEEKAMALGVRRLLMKPVLRNELAQAVRKALDEKNDRAG